MSDLPALTGLAALDSRALAQANPNQSYINGVQFGLQPFCYHDLAMNTQNRPALVRRLVQNGTGMVELHATLCEPRFDGPGVNAQQAREKLRNRRVTAPADYCRKIQREFDDAGITIFAYYVNISDADTDGEIDATFEAARILGAKGCVGSYGLQIAHRLVPFPRRHGLFVGRHNHDKLSDPDAFNTEQSSEKGLAFSLDFKATLDVRHFTAANGDCLGFLERHTSAYRASISATGEKTTGAVRRSAKATRHSSRSSG